MNVSAMNAAGWGEIVFTLAVTLALAVPLGFFLARVWKGESTWLDPVLKPVESGLYWLFGVDAKKSQNWFGYTLSMLAFSTASFLALYLILRFQDLLPFNPQGFKGVSPDLAFDTSISFVTNTNWQSYVPEQALSAFSQMAGLTSHNFLSAAAGIAIAAAVARAFAANRGEGLGNFWVDLTRISLYVLLPLSIILALLFVAQGEPQTLTGHVDAVGVEGAKQTIILYPTASQEAIKQLGTNGGGIFNANSAHPYENPNPLTNLVEIVIMNVLGYACVIAFGIVALARKEARALVAVMALFVFAAAAVVYWTETRPAPAMQAVHASTAVNMEGKEVRFGAPSTAIWTAATTGASDGGVNGMIDSYMPLGGGMAMFMIQLGEMLPGGVGSGLYGMVVMALIDVRDVLGLAADRVQRRLGSRRLSQDFPDQLSMIRADPALLEQSLVNILENAIAYSPDGSLIEAAAFEDRGNVVISIEDEGRGIPTAELEHVFEKFRRMEDASDRVKGTGLGLTIAKGFIEAMGGRIAAASPIHEGKGTRVLISLHKDVATPALLL